MQFESSNLFLSVLYYLSFCLFFFVSFLLCPFAITPSRMNEDYRNASSVTHKLQCLEYHIQFIVIFFMLFGNLKLLASINWYSWADFKDYLSI